MKSLVRRLLMGIAPVWTTEWLSRRARAHSHRVVRGWGCAALNEKLITHLGPTVQEGPFAGEILTPMASAEHLGPFLLGVYESELDAAWDIVFRRTYPQIVDIGAKFGYYAVGLARRYPEAAVVAFDTDSWARRATREMAAANHVANIELRSFCGPEWLKSGLRPGAFVISDCEGYEADLFSPDVAPHLCDTTLIIETHDGIVAGVTDRLRAIFAPTHDVREFGVEASRRVSSRPLEFLSAQEAEFANREIRPPTQSWLLCVPRTRS